MLQRRSGRRALTAAVTWLSTPSNSSALCTERASSAICRNRSTRTLNSTLPRERVYSLKPARTYIGGNGGGFSFGSEGLRSREELVELRGFEPLTPRLPALCSPN